MNLWILAKVYILFDCSIGGRKTGQVHAESSITSRDQTCNDILTISSTIHKPSSDDILVFCSSSDFKNISSILQKSVPELTDADMLLFTLREQRCFLQSMSGKLPLPSTTAADAFIKYASDASLGSCTSLITDRNYDNFLLHFYSNK